MKKILFGLAGLAVITMMAGCAEDEVSVSAKSLTVEEDVSAIAADFPLNMMDDEVANAIHAMSHQKVISEDDEKWGAKIPLTQERVERLLEVVENSQHDLEFERESLYFEILNRWVEGDFSEIARDHNAIWYNQGGTVGYAEGTMTPEQEAKYIEDNFNN